MERLLKSYLNTIKCVSLLTALLMLFSCKNKAEKVKDAAEYGFHFYQGKPQHMNAFKYATELDSTNASNWRELSVTYLKRGIPQEWKPYYEKAVKHDSITWQPWRGYLYLWFYRDYKKAIADFDASDTLTPNFTDAPQGMSVDYWRGVAYLGLEDYDNAIAYFNKYIGEETKNVSEEWVNHKSFLFKGIAHFEKKEYKEALLNFDKVIQFSEGRTADAYYYKALTLAAMGNQDLALKSSLKAKDAFKKGFSNKRPYVEEMRQIYKEDIEDLLSELKKS